MFPAHPHLIYSILAALLGHTGSIIECTLWSSAQRAPPPTTSSTFMAVIDLWEYLNNCLCA